MFQKVPSADDEDDEIDNQRSQPIFCEIQDNIVNDNTIITLPCKE